MTAGPTGPGPTREARLQRTRGWLRYAARDLAAARDALRPGSPASPYHAAFWAQQAAEKALKGVLTYAGVRFEGTHRLNVLAALLPAGWNTRRAAGALGELTRYGVETRYPDVGEPEPTAEDARRAVDQASSVLQAVWRDLEAHGFPITSPQPPQ
jgi:HEPN domain-containing protein